MQPSDLKSGLKASDLARWEWCQEESFLRCHGVERAPTSFDFAGTAVHKKAVREPEQTWEKEFFDKLQKEKPFFREVDGVRIYGGVDAFDPELLKEGIVRIIECKTRGERNVPPFLVGPAIFQLQIYLWIFEPVMKRIGYKLADAHYVDFVHRESMEIISRYACPADTDAIGEKIKNVLSFIRKNEFITGAVEKEKWKCKNCAAEFKSRCRFYRD